MPRRAKTWEAAQVAAGNCCQCTLPRDLYSHRCNRCQEQFNRRQQQRRRRRLAAGNCAECGQPRNLHPWRCDQCAVRRRERRKAAR